MIAAAPATGARQEELAGALQQVDRKARRLTVVGKRNKLWRSEGR
jgi:hypothetical protein